MVLRRDKAVRSAKVKARVLSTNFQLSLKEGKGIEERSGKGDLVNKGGRRRGRSKDRKVKWRNLHLENDERK